jgi:hypothetical protein
MSLDASNVVRVKIGRDDMVPLLDVDSVSATANGSTVSNVNPVLLILDQDDMTMNAAVYDIEVIVLDSAAGEVVTSMSHGVFVVHNTQLGSAAV